MARATLALFCAQFLWLAGPGAAQSPWLAAYGEGGCGSNFVPTLHTGGEMPTLGNAKFQVIAKNLTGGAPGLFCLSNAAADLPFLGMRLYIDPRLGLGIGCHAVGTGGIPGAGVASASLSIPRDAALAGGKFFLQGLFIDNAFPFSLVTTHGLGITIAQSIPAEIAVIQDRLNYQAHFTGVNQAVADQLGRTIWAANQVAGFGYLKTEPFTCGGESHWMVIVQHGQTGLEFNLIPGGIYRMGDIHLTGLSWEQPVRWVHIKPFLVARTEVTQSAWQAVMGSNPSLVQGPTLPMDLVGWTDAQAFCARTGLRLPSEAEWEYACRAGVTNCYSFGENYPPTNLDLYAWTWGNSGYRTNPVGQKLPNAFGLFDMHGNVREWVEDAAPGTMDYNCAPSDGRAWSGGSSQRITRGGGWMNGYHEAFRSAYRYPGGTLTFIGFRPAASL